MAGRAALAGGAAGDRAGTHRRYARAGVRAYLRWVPVALVAVPAGVYLAAYGHFFAVGYGWGDLVALHREMLAYHREIGVVHADVSRWWTWPLAAQPV